MEQIKLNLRPMLKRLEIPSKKEAKSVFAGSYVSMFKGHGLEFTGFRTYTPDDDATLIDWKASLRTKNLMIRQFTEERNLNIFFMLDVSDSMLVSSIDKLKCEYAAELMASLSFVALESDDNVGMAMFTDKIVQVVPLGKGPRQYFLIKKALTNPHLYGGGFDMGRSLKYALSYLPRNSTLIILSDFFGLKGDWAKDFKSAASKYSIYCLIIRDRLDKDLPDDDGQVIFSDPFSDEKKLISPGKIRQDYKREAELQLNILKKVFTKTNSYALELMTDQPYVRPITKFFAEKSRRWK